MLIIVNIEFMHIAQSDSHALELIQGRLGEIRAVAFMSKLVKVYPNKFPQEELKYFTDGGYPNWTIIRALMPVIESIGDLVNDGKSTDNLIWSLKELGKHNTEYLKFPYIISSLYRHSLIHQDEMRELLIDGNKTIHWSISYGIPSSHLLYHKDNVGNLVLNLDLDALLDDIYRVLSDLIIEAKRGDFKGVLEAKYNSWTILDINNPGRVIVNKNKILEEYNKI